MSLNKQKGNMYPFVTHTWNPIRGKCPHDCEYCYMKAYLQPELRFVEKEMGAKLGKGNTIFVGSSTDMWATPIPTDWIRDVLWHCWEYRDNNYLFQSKNPARFNAFASILPVGVVLGTTIESNVGYPVSKAPSVQSRYEVMCGISVDRMVSIEPIMDFDLGTLVMWIAQIKPKFVSIGADSKGHNLPEPPADKIRSLIQELKNITIVKVKDNLKRLLGDNLRQEVPQ